MSSNKNILFSVIIPTFNRADLLGEAIESILAQTYPNWELIIVDDGSTDNTSEVVGAYKDNRIKYFYQKNKELNEARNSGVRLSTGDYICFLDDDDYYLPNHLDQLYKLILKHDNKVAVYKTGLLLKLDDKERKIKNYNIKKHKNPVNYILFGNINLLPLSFHRDIFKKFYFNNDCLLFDDHNFLIKVLLKYPFFEASNYTAVYIKHNNARTFQYYQDNKKIKNLLECVNELFVSKGMEIEKITHTKIKEELLASFYIGFAHKSIEYKNYSIAINYILKANRVFFNYNILKRTIVVIMRLTYRIIIRK